MPIIFLSYASVDSEFALRLARDLRAVGVRLWMDRLDLKAGVEWTYHVEQALESCTTLLVVLSPAAVESRTSRTN